MYVPSTAVFTDPDEGVGKNPVSRLSTHVAPDSVYVPPSATATGDPPTSVSTGGTKSTLRTFVLRVYVAFNT